MGASEGPVPILILICTRWCVLLTPTGPLADQQARSFIVSKLRHAIKQNIHMRYWFILLITLKLLITWYNYWTNSSIINRNTPSPHGLLQGLVLAGNCGLDIATAEATDEGSKSVPSSHHYHQPWGLMILLHHEDHDHHDHLHLHLHFFCLWYSSNCKMPWIGKGFLRSPSAFRVPGWRYWPGRSDEHCCIASTLMQSLVSHVGCKTIYTQTQTMVSWKSPSHSLKCTVPISVGTATGPSWASVKLPRSILPLGRCSWTTRSPRQRPGATTWSWMFQGCGSRSFDPNDSIFSFTRTNSNMIRWYKLWLLFCPCWLVSNTKKLKGSPALKQQVAVSFSQKSQLPFIRRNLVFPPTTSEGGSQPEPLGINRRKAWTSCATMVWHHREFQTWTSGKILILLLLLFVAMVVVVLLSLKLM